MLDTCALQQSFSHSLRQYVKSCFLDPHFQAATTSEEEVTGFSGSRCPTTAGTILTAHKQVVSLLRDYRSAVHYRARALALLVVPHRQPDHFDGKQVRSSICSYVFQIVFVSRICAIYDLEPVSESTGFLRSSDIFWSASEDPRPRHTANRKISIQIVMIAARIESVVVILRAQLGRGSISQPELVLGRRSGWQRCQRSSQGLLCLDIWTHF
jgi:hypothetical protein